MPQHIYTLDKALEVARCTDMVVALTGKGQLQSWAGRCHEISLAVLRTGVFGLGRIARGYAHANKITRNLIYDMAEELGISGADYSVRTVKTLLRREAVLMDETHLLDL